MRRTNHNHILAGGVLASISASVCCLGPFVLLATGMSGAWMSQLMALKAYQPYLIGIALIAFVFAGRRIFFSPLGAVESGASSSVDARPADSSRAFWACAVLALILVTSEIWIVALA